jgi:hypothetical protein
VIAMLFSLLVRKGCWGLVRWEVVMGNIGLEELKVGDGIHSFVEMQE